MKKEEIERLIRIERIRQRSIDLGKIRSLLESSKVNSEVILSLKSNEKTATVIFREIYESIRQLGDALWGIKGYEPLDHDISLEILKDLPIKNSVKLNFLDRFRKIRHDANYRGFKVTESQANEIISFWNEEGLEIHRLIQSKINK